MAAALAVGSAMSLAGPAWTERKGHPQVEKQCEDESHEAPQRLVISIEGTRVQLVDELGRTTNLVADGKKQERLTGDGEFKSVTRFEGSRLVVEGGFRRSQGHHDL